MQRTKQNLRRFTTRKKNSLIGHPCCNCMILTLVGGIVAFIAISIVAGSVGYNGKETFAKTILASIAIVFLSLLIWYILSRNIIYVTWPRPVKFFAYLAITALTGPLFAVAVYPVLRPFQPIYHPRSEPFDYIILGYSVGGLYFQWIWITLVVDILFNLVVVIRRLVLRLSQKRQSIFTPPNEEGDHETINVGSSSAVKKSSSSGSIRQARPTRVAWSETDRVGSLPRDEIVDDNKCIRCFDKTYGFCCPMNPFPRPIAFFCILLGLIFSSIAFATATKDPLVLQHEVVLPFLPPEMDGFRIAHMSDIHVGSTVGAKKLNRAIDLVFKEKPHAVMITGDLWDAPSVVIEPGFYPLARLMEACDNDNPPSGPIPVTDEDKDSWPCVGVLFVGGNHEHYYPYVPDKLQFLSTNIGMRVLWNERVALGWLGIDDSPSVTSPNPALDDTIDVAGVPDWVESLRQGPWDPRDLPKTLEDRENTRGLVVMSHNPASARQALGLGAGLVLSGHVHGGQMFPFSLGAMAIFEFFAGLYNVDARNYGYEGLTDGLSHVFVSRGVWYWGPPMRLFAPHDMAILTLRSAST